MSMLGKTMREVVNPAITTVPALVAPLAITAYKNSRNAAQPVSWNDTSKVGRSGKVPSALTVWAGKAKSDVHTNGSGTSRS